MSPGYKKMSNFFHETLPLSRYAEMSEADRANPASFYKRMEEKMRHDIVTLSPLKPIYYSETDRFLKTLSTCGKFGFWDTKENVASLLPFVNDNPDGRKYLSGDEPFLRIIVGWPIIPIRENYVEKRIKTMVSSGIFAHWNSWLRRVRPHKIFHHYANWTYPRIRAESQLTPESKILAGFYMFGICIVGSLFCFLFETVYTCMLQKSDKTRPTYEFTYLP